MIRRYSLAANVVMLVGALYVLQLFDVTPVGVLNQTASLVLSTAVDALGLSDWWSSKDTAYGLLCMLCGIAGLYFLFTTLYAQFKSTWKDEVKG